ncbi:MAG: hypothetical protein BWY24_00066 [Microgenomates group bacterium ADurb.Bin219]|nr:MAG: hypothetical protein BWY24_00066 [Microgenomates group bacterium ADurb.Bin219]HNP89087.1 hypothetical protein [Candidatus Woesebacteria bacterium]
MNKNYPISELQNLIEQAAAVQIVLAANPRFDSVAAALAFKLALQKRGKPVNVIAASAMTVEFNRLVGVETIGQKNESGSNLVISLNYPLDQIEKVSYNDEGGHLNLVVEPKAGAPRVERNQAEFSYQGGQSGLTFIIGANNNSDFGSLNKELNFNEAVFIGQTQVGSAVGRLNIIDQQASSNCEIMTALISDLGWMADEDIAGNLLLGLENATRNFSGEASADAFEAAAICLRWGAKRAASFANRETQGRTFTPNRPQSNFRPQPAKTFDNRTNKPAATGNPATPASPDWLEPKVYKSSEI